jgi:hypothetical protein
MNIPSGIIEGHEYSLGSESLGESGGTWRVIFQEYEIRLIKVNSNIRIIIYYERVYYVVYSSIHNDLLITNSLEDKSSDYANSILVNYTIDEYIKLFNVLTATYDRLVEVVNNFELVMPSNKRA